MGSTRHPKQRSTTTTGPGMGPLPHGANRVRLWPWLLAIFFFIAQPVGAAQTVTLNLKDADINALVTTVAEATGKNFIVDPRVKGKVTVISSRAMEKGELYQVFLSILSVHGFAAVPSGKIIKIVPDANAKQDSIPTVTGRAPGRGDEVVTRVIQIEHVAAAQLVPILRPLIPQQGHLAAYPPTNVLILTDHAANIQRLVAIISRIDVAGSEDIEVMPLQHAAAAEVVRILLALEAKADKGAPEGDKPKLVADDRTNSILMTAARSDRLRLRAIISHLDTPLETGGNTHVIYLRYANAKDLVPVLTGVGTSISADKKGAPRGPAARQDISIQADESTNALVITAPPDLMRSLRTVIQQLDVRRAQVLVEAVIAEVSSTKATELGIQWRTSLNTVDGTYGGTTFPGNSAGSIDGFPGSPIALGQGLSVGFFRGGSIRALIRALASDNATNVLSTPSLVTMDNEEAEIVVGQNVPFVTGQYTNSTTSPGNPFQTFERRDIGIVLKVKPQINEGDAVKLEIEQEVSSVQSDTSGANLITNKRSIKTSVLVDDSNTVVLGGLIKDDLQETLQKVPGLGDLPIIGALFRNKRTDLVKTNLMVFLRPDILRDAKANIAQTNSKYNFIRALQLQQAEKGVGLMPGEQVPVLPAFDETLVLPPPYDEIRPNDQPAATDDRSGN